MGNLSTQVGLALVWSLGLAACGPTTPVEHPKPSVATSAATATSPSAHPSRDAPFPSQTASVQGESDEAGAQGETNPGDNHPLPTYNSFEEVAIYPQGVLTARNGGTILGNEYDPKADLEQLFPPEKTYSGSDDEVAKKVFAKLLYYYAASYSGYRPLHDYGYIVFQDDKVDPITQQPLQHEGANINLELVLDASGSMAKQIDGRSMMDIAKASITKTIQQLPPNANVALRVYGHKGNNKAAGKAESCASSELIQPMGPVNLDAINTQLANISPTGWTPLGASIAKGGEDFAARQGENQLNILYVVSDGIETCDGDPIAAAANLKQLNVKPVLGIIGFNVDPTQELNLKQIAQAGGGHYAGANNADSLVKELEQIHILANSKYDWKPLESSDVTKVTNAHAFEGSLYIENEIGITKTEEFNFLVKNVNALRTSKRFDNAILDRVHDLAIKRNDSIHQLRDQLTAARKDERERIKAEYNARLGQPAMVIIPTQDK